ncbi:MAG TPA: alpha/beta fold hydrolase [Gaiellaceae bacterium]|nr:alpha/beta fold hydrolase [Gaiellaceae bacterium]
MTRPRLVLLHGSVTNAALSWGAQSALADRFELVRPNRPGFPPNPPVERVDFDSDAVWLEGVVRPGDHLVGHSYGGVVALLAAPRLPLASLTVIEPPAFGVARGDPAVERWLGEAAALPRDSVRAYLEAFLHHVGAPFPLPDPLPPDLQQGAEAFYAERRPDEAVIPLGPLPHPVLLVTGDHEPAFEAVADVLCARLQAERLVLPGAGHAVQRAEGFNDAIRRRFAPPHDGGGAPAGSRA